MKKYLFFTLLFLIVFSTATMALIFHAASPAMTHPPCSEANGILRLPLGRQTQDDHAKGPHTLRMVTYNIGYASGKKNNVGNILTKKEVVANLAQIVDSLRKLDADIIGLQEVDFSSARTFDIDQLKWISESLGLPYVACVTTWNVTYLPWPYWPLALHYGMIVSGQAILSRFPILDHEVHRFEKPEANPFWYNWFYPDRVAQKVAIGLSGSSKDKSSIVVIWHTHLEAFDHAARRQQAEKLANLVSRDVAPLKWILGDLNSYSLLQPDLSADERKKLEESDEALKILLQQTGMNNAEGDKPIYTMPSWDPVKKIDHILFAPSLKMKEVGSTPGIIASDHLPVWADFEIR